PRLHVINKQFRLRRRLISLQFVRRSDGGNDDQFALERRRNPLDGKAAERLPETIHLPRFWIIPAKSAAGVMPQPEPAKVEPAVGAERGTVHEPDTSGLVKVPKVSRVTPRVSLVGCGIAGRSTLAQSPCSRGIEDKEMAVRIAAGIKL